MQTKTILLVEDEPIICADVQDRLEVMGYRVCLAMEVAEAVLLCSEQVFDRVLINFKQKTIPDGMLLAKILRGGQPIAFITGARQQDIIASKNYDSQYPILYKPFTSRQLQAFIQN